MAIGSKTMGSGSLYPPQLTVLMRRREGADSCHDLTRTPHLLSPDPIRERSRWRDRLCRGFRLEPVESWTVVTVAGFAALGAACEWEYTATFAVGLAKPRRVDNLDQNALLDTDTL